jgi:hypothetical protein
MLPIELPFPQTPAGGPKISAAAMLAHLRAEVTIFTGNIELHDDLTIVVAQV